MKFDMKREEVFSILQNQRKPLPNNFHKLFDIILLYYKNKIKLKMQVII